jgi:hypothetical protein
VLQGVQGDDLVRIPVILNLEYNGQAVLQEHPPSLWRFDRE